MKQIVYEVEILKADFTGTSCQIYIYTLRISLVGSDAAWNASGTKINPGIVHILS